MTEQKPSPDYSDVEMRRSKKSNRRMSRGRRAAYWIGLPLLRALLFLLNASYRKTVIRGDDVVRRMIDDTGQPYVPCYWHQQHIVCSYMVRDWLHRGLKAGYIISASVDGEVPARVAGAWGAEVIRGSAAYTGALVLRDAKAMMSRGVSIVTTSDGPVGPKFEFKAGTVLMARIGGAPMVPVACAASRAWYLDTWDEFMIPKPFARVVIAIGEPVVVPRNASMDDIEALRATMQDAIEGLVQETRAAVVSAT